MTSEVGQVGAPPPAYDSVPVDTESRRIPPGLLRDLLRGLLRGRLRGRRLTMLVGGLLALGVGIVEVIYRLAPYPSDQLNYFEAARDFPSHPTYAGLHQFLRHGLIIPMWLAQQVFGYSQVAYLIVPMLASVGLAVGVYVLGVLLFNRVVGVGAAILTIGNSIVFPDLTAPLPDLPATTLFCWAVVLAVALRQRGTLVTATRSRETATLIGLGVLLGWSYLTREYIVFVWPLIPILLVRKIPVRRLLWILLPLAVVGLGESILNAVVFGDPLARLHASASHGDGTPPVTDFLGHSREWYLTRLTAVTGSTPEGTLLKAALVATVLGGFLSRRLALLLAWAASFYVPLVALGGFLDPDAPMLRILKERYWLPLVPAVMLSATAGLWLLVRGGAPAIPFLRSRGVLIAGIVTLAAVAVPVTVAEQARRQPTPATATYAANGGTGLEEFRSWLAGEGPEVTTLWTERRAIRLVRIFVNGAVGGPIWNGRLETWSPVAGKPRPAAGDYVFLYSARSRVCNPCRANAEALLGRTVSVPSGWRPVFASSDGLAEVYQVR
ncbi:glycosyltransferase family 39 protein [Actinopolymorpha alba]|uniref:glycosyltransferase family 39 protein n=1 Tax=Actinopolymorpha alba TaxID=533267 RepID=UPI00036981FE|nr:glycosyltransferase family 39 protein [Actinopolymorpha alba]